MECIHTAHRIKVDRHIIMQLVIFPDSAYFMNIVISPSEDKQYLFIIAVHLADALIETILNALVNLGTTCFGIPKAITERR